METSPRSRTHLWGSELCRPGPIAAILLLCLNDHLGKTARVFPDFVHGKMSDFAGLFFFPILLFTLVDLVPGGLRRRKQVAWGCAALTVLGFTLVKTWPALQAFVSAYWGTIVLDATDLVALPAAPLSVWWMLANPSRRASPTWARLTVLLFAALGSMATQAPRMHRQYPEWRITSEATLTLGCSELRVWVSKTGKEGMAITLRTSGQSGCTVAIRGARFQVDGVDHPCGALPPPFVLDGSQALHGYLPFPFDGEKAWNRGQREGRLWLSIVEGNEPPRDFALAMVYRLDAFHEDRLLRRAP
jgi:hypothetical protein